MDKILIAVVSACVGIALKAAWDSIAEHRRTAHLKRAWLTELSQLRSSINAAEATADWTGTSVKSHVERLRALCEAGRLDAVFKRPQERRDVLVLYNHLQRYLQERDDAPSIPVTTILTASLDEVPFELSALSPKTPMQRLDAARTLLKQLSEQHASGTRVPRKHFDATAAVYLKTAGECYGTSTGGYAHSLEEVRAALSDYQTHSRTRSLRRLSDATEAAENALSG